MGLVQQSGPSLAESKGGIPFNLVEDLSCSLVHDRNDDIVLKNYKAFRDRTRVDSGHHSRE